MNRYDLGNKVVVVTGGAGGIGRAVASLSLASGARVSLWDRSEAALQDAAHALGSDNGKRISLRVVDVTSEGDIARALADDVTAHGRIDAFVNNAGILGEVLPLWETDPSTFVR